MRKSLAIKTLLRAPLKTILTFLLIAAASFALFSRVLGYVVTVRETARAERFYTGVAALDNSTPDSSTTTQVGSTTFGTLYGGEDKPWPSDQQIEEFTSLPGVTMAETRYMTAGLVEDYKRLIDKESLNETSSFIIEGTYLGYEQTEGTQDYIDLAFDDVTLLAGSIEVDFEEPFMITTFALEDPQLFENPFPAAFFDKLDKGSRCLVLGSYNEVTGKEIKLDDTRGEDAFRVLDGLSDQYLETEAFTFYKEMIEAINQTIYTYDIVYTSDMRSIPRFNERNMVITEGRPLTTGDAEGCVVSELVMETYGLSLGDTISIRLGDQLFRQSGVAGTKARDPERISNFTAAAELEIVGVYQFTDSYMMRSSEYQWSYTPNAIFVPQDLLPVEVPVDFEISAGQFSVFIENARDIEEFYAAAEPLAREMGVALRFSDGGWLSMKDSFETGSRTALLTTVLYLAGAALALLLAVYLYLNRNKKTYAIMRTQGVSAGNACRLVELPLAVLAALAILSGGTAGLLQASVTTAETLVSMAAGTADTAEYVLNSSIPFGMVLLCLLCELLFTALIIWLFMQKIKRTPLLELLQDNVTGARAEPKAAADSVSTGSLPTEPTITVTRSEVSDRKLSQRGKYHALSQVTAYILRHMRRGIDKTAISLTLVVVLAAGIGMFVLARLTFRDAFRETHVNGRALEFSSAAVAKLAKSDLVKDFYCHGNFHVRINGQEHDQPLTLTNDLERYLGENYSVTYAAGYDDSFMDNSGPLCLLGQAAAEAYDVRPGDEIALFPENLHYTLTRIYEDEEKLQAAIERETTMYKIAGIIHSDDAAVSSGIFAAANSAAEETYGQPYPFEYSEFRLSDNERLDELDNLLDGYKRSDDNYAPMASFYIDSAGLENIRQVRELLNLLFPAAVTAAVIIGMFGPGLLIMQQSREAAFMRVLGVTKKRVRCILAFEQILLSVIGISCVALGLVLYRPELFGRAAGTLALCGGLYLLGGVCGAFTAAVLVTRRRALELLQVKE